MNAESKPLVLITGSAGKVGTALSEFLGRHYQVIGCDRPGKQCDIEMDITDDDSVANGINAISDDYGKRVAAVIHLAAYFDFSGEHSPLYDKINVEGTRRLLEGLQQLEVERFIYSGTMLVHEPAKPGGKVSEDAPVKPGWAYPQSKARTEEVIREYHGSIPYTILRLAGLYDSETAVPTLSQQIARIYERNLKSQVYAGDLDAGQAMIHQDDMSAVFKAVIDKRSDLPEGHALLAGEDSVMGYQELQDTIGELIHGREEWKTLNLPKPVAKTGAWLEEKSEPLVPDELDRGEKPFVRPFMVDLASDHYDLDISRARDLLDWQPEHHIRDELPSLVENLKQAPLDWYRNNGITPPDWMLAADEKNKDPEQLRADYVENYRRQHFENLWAPFLNIALGFWLITSPFTLGYESHAMGWSDMLVGAVVVVLAAFSISPKPAFRFTRWGIGLAGLWVTSAPLIFWVPTAAAYLNGTLVGALLMSLAVLVRPFPGLSPAAAMTGPNIPPGWEFSPSDWTQRMPIIMLAFVGFYISRYMAAYQLEHIEAVWDPFFAGALPNAKNGTEEIITSPVSEAWPVPDAGLGALTYLLEILTGIIGSRARWRTMPWLVLLFGFMIVPLGAVSITFIVIQPIVLDTWCTLCLIAAAAMLIQIPYSFDEIVATIDFLRRRAKAGRPWMLILFTGDTDDNPEDRGGEEKIIKTPAAFFKDIFTGGVNFPISLLACVAVGIWLMFTRLTLGSEGGMANADHLIGSMVVTITVTAFAEVMRPLRYLNIPFGLALLVTPFIYGADMAATAASLVAGVLLIGLSFPRGPMEFEYGSWTRYARI